MHIVWPAAYYGRHRGSFVPAIEHVARRLRARGDTMDVVLPDLGPVGWYDDLRSAGAGVHVVAPYDARAAARRTVELRPDVVHAHFDGWLVTVTAALWPSRARVLWHLHSTFQPDGGPLRFTLRRAVKFRVVGRRVERFVCVTDTIAGEAVRLGVSARKTVTVRNCVDGTRFRRPAPGERRAARDALGLNGEPAIAFFGRDPGIKGADVLAAALERVPGATVLAVATPDPTMAQLARHARVIGVPFADDVRRVLWPADALALPSRGEGMPYVALEALACGVPVVASDLPWALELAAVTRGIAVAPSGNAVALGDALAATLRAAPVADPGETADLEQWAARIVALYGGTVFAVIARISTVAGFEAERERWEALYRRDPLSQVFLSWPWLRAYLDQARGAWTIVTLSRGAELVAALPITLQSVPSRIVPIARQLMFASDPIADYQGMLCAAGAEDEATRTFAGVLRALPWDRALIRDVADPRVAAVLERLGRGHARVELTGTTICLRTALPGTWDAYTAGLGKNTRGKTSRSLRRLHQELPHFRVSSPVDADIGAHVEAQVRLNHARWGGNLRSARATFGRLFHATYDRGCLRHIVAWDGDRAIAGVASFVDGTHKTYNLYQLAYDREYGRFSPGKVVAGLAIREAIELGYELFDFLRGDEEYKRSYARDVVTTSHYRMTRRTARAAAYDGISPAYRALKAAAVRVAYGPGRTV